MFSSVISQLRAEQRGESSTIPCKTLEDVTKTKNEAEFRLCHELFDLRSTVCSVSCKLEVIGLNDTTQTVDGISYEFAISQPEIYASLKHYSQYAP